jgi:hypothetical protein
MYRVFSCFGEHLNLRPHCRESESYSFAKWNTFESIIITIMVAKPCQEENTNQYGPFKVEIHPLIDSFNL